MHRAFRFTMYGFIALMVVTMFAAANVAADDAGWAERWLGYSTAIGPWLLSAVVVWVAGEVVSAIGRADTKA